MWRLKIASVGRGGQVTPNDRWQVNTEILICDREAWGWSPLLASEVVWCTLGISPARGPVSSEPKAKSGIRNLNSVPRHSELMFPVIPQPQRATSTQLD